MSWLDIVLSKTFLRSRYLKDCQQQLEEGKTQYSQSGSTLKLYVTRMEQRGIPYQIKAYPGLGYEISRIEPLMKEE